MSRAAAVLALVVAGAAACTPSPQPSPTVVVRPKPIVPTTTIDARMNVSIRVEAAIMADDASPPATFYAREKETWRRRLRESVRDLERVLHATAGCTAIVDSSDEPAPAESFRIDIGARAVATHGPVGVAATYGQGFRVIVSEHAAALYGENDLSTSYAIYELLDRLGCRWFIPGPLGEVLPPTGRALRVALADDRLAPSTLYRSIWYADDAWKRRNREGGLRIEAGHALEMAYLAPEDRAAHPEWVATIEGKPHPSRLRWSSETLASRLGDRILERQAKDPIPSYSISPDDGFDFDESPEDRALDTNDFDPTTGKPSITDRFLVLANRVAKTVARTAPDVALGFLAYVQYTHAPKRERLEPSLVPMIAPITYARAHPMNDDRVPDNRDLRNAIDRWGQLAGKGTSVYFYGWFLAEPVAPNPMLTKWGHDVPYVLAHNAQYWMPETIPNFETSMHALYMSMRLAFDKQKKPQDVYDEIDTMFYGPAGPAMHAYWKEVDRIWIETPEYSGGLFGQTRRFTRERLFDLRRLLDAAKRISVSPAIARRIELADDSLSLFHELMELRHDFVSTPVRDLGQRGALYRARAASFGTKWKDASAFAITGWAPETIYAHYYDAFSKPAFMLGDLIRANEVVHRVQRSFRYRGDPSVSGAKTFDAHFALRSFDDSKWKTTDVGLDSWSALGLHDSFGSMWYRAKMTLAVPLFPANHHAHLTLFAVDGAVRVFVNGNEARYEPGKDDPKDPTFSGGPARFDVTNLFTTGDNTIAIFTARKALNEIGVSGLMGPVTLSVDK